MRWLLFLSKLAFICNLAFLISFVLRFTNWLSSHDIKAYIVIIGWVLSIIFNPAVNIIYLFIFWIKRTSLTIVPVWLVVMNILFLFLQVIFLLLMNVDKY